MFLVKAGSTIQVQQPASKHYIYTTGWRPYTTKEDKLYDKEEVWDIIAVHQDRGDIPPWAERNILEHGYTILKREGKYAMVRPKDLEYLD